MWPRDVGYSTSFIKRKNINRKQNHANHNMALRKQCSLKLKFGWRDSLHFHVQQRLDKKGFSDEMSNFLSLWKAELILSRLLYTDKIFIRSRDDKTESENYQRGKERIIIAQVRITDGCFVKREIFTGNYQKVKAVRAI